MGHAIHFLQRLERVDYKQADLALRLYRKQDLLKLLLHFLDVPEQHERFAISLDEDEKGPYLVLTREGEFVTCLGKGMSVDKLFVVPHGRFSAHLKKAEDFFKDREQAKEVVGESLEHLLELLFYEGDTISREKFWAVSTVQPILWRDFLQLWFETSQELFVLRYSIRGSAKAKKAPDDVLWKLWCHFWGQQHLMVLSLMGGQGPLRRTFDELSELSHEKGFENPGFQLTFGCFFTGITCQMIRAIWALGRLGSLVFAECKRKYFHSKNMFEWLFAACGLVVIGLRHKRYHKEVEKALFSGKLAKSAGAKSFISSLTVGEGFLQILLMSFKAPEQGLEMAEDMVRKAYGMDENAKKSFERSGYESIDDVSPELLFASFANNTNSLFKTPDFALLIGMLLPWLSKCEAEDLYLPEPLNQLEDYEWDRSYTLSLLEEWDNFFGTPVPAESKKIPRNAPCPCGSGKKYKKCCLRKNTPST